MYHYKARRIDHQRGIGKRVADDSAFPHSGHEERNVEFLLNGGMALRVTKTFPVDEAIYQLYANPERIRLMEESIRLYHKPHASEDLAEFVMTLQP